MTEDNAMAAIGASFGIGASIGGGVGPDAADMAASAAAPALYRTPRKRPVMPFNFPPGIITATAVGSYIDLPNQFGPSTGWFWDILSLSIQGFTAGSISVTKNFPAVTPAGALLAIEPVASFAAAGTQNFPQHGTPLLDSSERLVFTVTSTLTGFGQVSGMVAQVPSERIDEYLG
jgi:hypothetical protein